MAARKRLKKTPTLDQPTSSLEQDSMEDTPSEPSYNVLLIPPPREADPQDKMQQVRGHQDSSAPSGQPSSLEPAAVHDSASMVAFSLSTPTKDDPQDFSHAFRHAKDDLQGFSSHAFRHVSHDHNYL